MQKTLPSAKAVYAFLPLVVITGFVQLLVPSTIHMIMKNYSVDPSTAGIIPLIYFTGILTSTIILTNLINHFSVKQILSAGAIIVSAGLIIISMLNNFVIFSLFYFFVGIGNGLLMVLPGLYSTHIYGKQGTRFQSMIFAFLAIGFVIGPVFPGFVSYENLPWRWCFAFPGILMMPALIPVLLTKYQPFENAAKLSLRTILQIIKFDKRFFRGIIIVVTLSAGTTAGLLTWLITFLENFRGLKTGSAHIVLSLMGLSSVIGRNIWGKISSKITCYKTMLIITPLSALFVFIAPLASSSIVNIIVFFIAIIFLCGINPLSMAAAAVYPQVHSSSAYSLFFCFGAIGGLVIPFGIGVVFQKLTPLSG